MDGFATIISDLSKKISRYEIMTNLIPGFVMYAIFTRLGYEISFGSEIWLQICVCYILGLINGRFSSLVIEGVCRTCKFVKWRGYDLYNNAKTERPFIAALQESANMYRSFASLFLLALLAVFYKWMCCNCSWICDNGYWIVLILLFFLFLFSYRKQVNEYVVKNIDEVINAKNK